jgi:hypothetical protein
MISIVEILLTGICQNNKIKKTFVGQGFALIIQIISFTFAAKLPDAGR